MLKIVSFTFNPFSENTYLLINENKEVLFIDPGMSNSQELSMVIDRIEREGLKPLKIINTHAHIDHIFGVTALKKKYQIPFGLHKAELPILNSAAASALIFGLEFSNTPEVDFYIKETDTIFFSDSELRVLFTPGHSPGSISFYNKAEDFVISGDVLFQNSIGRTDLPGGNQEELFRSIREQLFTLPGDTKVYSGHGPETQIRIEKEDGYLSHFS